MPIPRLAYIPLRISLAARLAIRSLALTVLLFDYFLFLLYLKDNISILFSKFFANTILSTKIPGVCTSSGLIYPGSTISSTSTIVVLAAGAIS